MRFQLMIAAALSVYASAAGAQTFEDYQQRQSDLVALSAVFGELHHIRRYCEPRREGDIWRERMKKLVELEEPEPAVREDMVSAFNRGYRAAQQRFSSCTRNARDHGAARAAQGERIVERLATPLANAIASDEAEEHSADRLEFSAPPAIRDR